MSTFLELANAFINELNGEKLKNACMRMKNTGAPGAEGAVV